MYHHVMLDSVLARQAAEGTLLLACTRIRKTGRVPEMHNNNNEIDEVKVRQDYSTN
jgi:hypothetical protein